MPSDRRLAFPTALAREDSMALHTWLLYLVAAVGLSLTPGPNSLLVLTHGALHGHRKTLFTVSGGAVGFLALIALSMLGIGAVLQASAGALTVLKLLGGAYLVWLGIQLWRAPAIQLQADASRADSRGDALFRQGLLTAVSNPKALLFYGAFLPQFIDPSRDLLVQFIVMATIFVAVEFVVEYLMALLAHRIRPLLERIGKSFNRACGGMFVAMGVALPMTR
jgi:threonine/homoserine/homoserine lactone efflux protein